MLAPFSVSCKSGKFPQNGEFPRKQGNPNLFVKPMGRMMFDLKSTDFQPLVDLSERHCTVGFGNFTAGEIGCFSNYPAEFQEIYHRNGWMKLDPVVRNCAPRAIVFDWDQCQDAKNPVMSTAREFGMHLGISLSSQIAGSGLIVSYSGNSRLTEAARAEAARLLHKSHLERLAQNALSLSKEQCEMVALFAHGMRAAHVAHYFEITEDAIKLRKRRIEHLLGVNNFLAAVHICAVAGVTTSL